MPETSTRIDLVNDLRLHVDDAGSVWRYDPVERRRGVVLCGRGSGAFDSEFFKELPTSSRRVCLLPDGQHIELAHWLLSSLPLDRVWLGRPYPHTEALTRFLPSFMDILPTEIHVSCGGWRMATTTDATTFEIAYRLLHDDDRQEQGFAALTKLASRQSLLELLKSHPAAPAILFPAFGNLAFGCGIIAIMLDPRWHVSPEDPVSTTPLYRHFHLGSRTSIDLAEDFATAPQIAADHTASPGLKVFAACVGCDKGQIDRSFSKKVGVGRDWLALWKGAKRTPAAAVLEASRQYLQFVANVWSDRLTPARQYVNGVLQPSTVGYAPQLFVPQHFFSIQDAVADWQSYLVSFNS